MNCWENKKIIISRYSFNDILLLKYPSSSCGWTVNTYIYIIIITIITNKLTSISCENFILQCYIPLLYIVQCEYFCASFYSILFWIRMIAYRNYRRKWKREEKKEKEIVKHALVFIRVLLNNDLYREKKREKDFKRYK